MSVNLQEKNARERVILERRRLRRKRRRARRIRALLIAVAVVAAIIAAVIGFTRPRDAPPRPDSVSTQQKIAALGWVGQDFLPVNDYSRPGTALKKVNALVVHYVGNPNTTAAQNRNYFAGLADSGETSASSNFIIGLDGEIVQCVPVTEVAYCSNWRNDDTLSIECCHPDETGKFTDDTYSALVRLTSWLCLEYGLDSGDLLRHYDINGKNCPKYFVENEEAWTSFKDDVQAALENLKADMSGE